MTTGARPTWVAAKGGNKRGGNICPSRKYSSRDMASHTTLKPRREGQDTQDELQTRNLQRELDGRERRKDINDQDHCLVTSDLDADADSDGNNITSDEDEDEDEDENEALYAELAKMEKERREDKANKDAQEELLKKNGNPLLTSYDNPTSFSVVVKRRWDDDVVFKNQARNGGHGVKTSKRFVNDTIRNDFHTKFLRKYMH
ncbi:OLC1v1025924C1 [Oldenlandia corymbosa var. corymbosa]|uniref:OLC1v1025924C1 n=1 Tax=Oldenlandia corymbosa var. corymbosa TaxID=529605 RepID=A0AAV1C796_OLDCO|nr:OLC1v1025924C1 [Oldenlandia corymbosa var. corymbosa]